MITLTKKFKITVGASALGFTYTLTSDDNTVVIDNSVGDYDGNTARTIEPTFKLLTVSSFGATYTLTVTEKVSEGVPCVKVSTFQLTNVCSAITASIANTPSSSNPFIYTATIAGGLPPYTLDWEFDDLVFNNRVIAGQNPLKLNLLEGSSPPSSTKIKLNITDANGCPVTAEYDHLICAPTVDNDYQTATCVDSYFDTTLNAQIQWKANSLLTANPCAGTTIDWDTLELVSPSDKIIVASSGNGVSIFVKDEYTAAQLILENNTFEIQFRVQDNRGIWSNTGIISLVVNVCTSTVELPARGRTQVVQLQEGENTSGTEVTFELEVYAAPEEEIDWTTFTFLAGPNQTLAKPDLLTGVNGGALKVPGCKTVTYTVDAGPSYENAELLQYQVDTKDGQTTNIGRVYVDFVPSTTPTTVDDTVTTKADLPTSIDVLANDTGLFNKASVIITTNPTQTGATAIPNADGTITFYSPGAGADTFQYKVRNTDDILSAAATVTVTVNNSGVANNKNQCKVSGVSLFDFLTAPYSTGGTWTASGSNPTALVISTPTNVDFSSAAAGEYEFTYSVGSSPNDVSTTVTVTVPAETITIGSISAGTINPFVGGNAKGTVEFTVADVKNLNSIYIEVDGPSTTVNYAGAITLNGGVGTGQIEYHDGAGSYDVTVYGTSTCGNVVNSGATTIVIS